MIVVEIASIRSGLNVMKPRIGYFYNEQELNRSVGGGNAMKGFFSASVAVRLLTMYFFLSKISDEQEG